jgi:hypothetical protein
MTTFWAASLLPLRQHAVGDKYFGDIQGCSIPLIFCAILLPNDAILAGMAEIPKIAG